jgi:hypothetical protein
MNIKQQNNIESILDETNVHTYYDIKLANTSKIFESEQIIGLTPEQIQEGEKFYNI